MALDDRPRGILSEADRRYLRNPEEYSKQAKYERRQAIIERVHEALHDFPLLVYKLNEDSRKEAFEDRDLENKDHTLNVLSSAFAFLYLGITDTVEPSDLAKDAFEDFVGDGVKRAYRERGVVLKDVDVSIDVTEADPDQPIEEMTFQEAQDLALAGQLDREEFREYADKVFLDNADEITRVIFDGVDEEESDESDPYDPTKEFEDG